MSFRAKDLHFDNEQPAFLRRLRGELTSGDSARHEQPIPRNKRMKKDDGEDDAPTYVLEDTKESLTHAEYEALVSGKDVKEKEQVAADTVDQASTEPEPKPKDRIAEVGSGIKKRKVAKIVNEEHGDEHTGESKGAKTSDVRATKKLKKAKSVKLTFDDE